MISPRWQPPWKTYFDDIPGSNYFRQLSKEDQKASYLIGQDGGQAVIYRWDKESEEWVVATRIDTAWRD